MASHPGAQPKRRAVSRRRSGKGATASPEAPPGPPDEQPAPAAAPETADIYRSLFNELRRAFGGTIDDANADAIAFAASELYRKDVEPRLWEHKTAQEILDAFGVPRSGAFTRYSLSDRLLLLRRSTNPSRAEQAHALLTELGAPDTGPGGGRLSLKERLQGLLEGTPPLPAMPRGSGTNGEQADGPGPGPAPDDVTPESQQLVEALETVRQVAISGIDGAASGPVADRSPDPPVAELVGLGTVIAGIQEELIRLRQAVETVQGGLDEALALLRGGAVGVGPALAGEGATAAEAPGPAVPVVEAAPAAGEPDGPEAGLVPPAPEAAVPPPDDVTEVVPIVADELTATGGKRRRRGLPKLIVIAVVLGLLIAGVAIAISVVGWSEMRDTLHIGSVYGGPAWVPALMANPNGDMWWTRSRR